MKTLKLCFAFSAMILKLCFLLHFCPPFKLKKVPTLGLPIHISGNLTVRREVESGQFGPFTPSLPPSPSPSNVLQVQSEPIFFLPAKLPYSPLHLRKHGCLNGIQYLIRLGTKCFPLGCLTRMPPQRILVSVPSLQPKSNCGVIWWSNSEEMASFAPTNCAEKDWGRQVLSGTPYVIIA